jgi:hypothetical protein
MGGFGSGRKKGAQTERAREALRLKLLAQGKPDLDAMAERYNAAHPDCDLDPQKLGMLLHLMFSRRGRHFSS